MAAFQTLSSSPSFPTRRELLCWSPKTRWISQRKARCFHCTDESGGQGKPWNLCGFGCHILGVSHAYVQGLFTLFDSWLKNDWRIFPTISVDCFSRQMKHLSGFPWIFCPKIRKNINFSTPGTLQLSRRLERWRDLFRLKLRSSWKHPHLDGPHEIPTPKSRINPVFNGTFRWWVEGLMENPFWKMWYNRQGKRIFKIETTT